MERPFANRAMDRLSELSYGVYLVHFVIVVYAIAYLGLPRDGTIGALVVWFAVIVPPALIYAAVTRRGSRSRRGAGSNGACYARPLSPEGGAGRSTGPALKRTQDPRRRSHRCKRHRRGGGGRPGRALIRPGSPGAGMVAKS